MNLESTMSRRQGTPLHRLLSIQIAIFSLLLACFALCMASAPARAAERTDLSLLSPQNSLLSLLTESGMPPITAEALPVSWNGAWSSSLQPCKAVSFSMLGGESIPVELFSTPSIVAGGGSTNCSITVNQTGNYVQVSCNYPSILISPSGSWPYHLNFPSGGSLTQSFTINTNSVSSNTTIEIYACEADLNISNPANWQATTNVTVTAQAGP